MGSLMYRPRAGEVQITLGPGEAGEKTRALRNDREAIKKAGFHYPDHAAMTPAYFERYLLESGALDAKTPEDAKRRILMHGLSKREKNELGDVIASFGGWRIFMVRSDDYPGGVGLWHSGPASVGLDASVKTLIGRIEMQVRNVLASDFSPDVRVFKERKNIAGNPGVLIMPIFGCEYDMGHFATPLSINYIGKLGGKGLMQVGPGIGGANGRQGRDHVVERISFGQLHNALSDRGTYGSRDTNVLEIKTGEMEEFNGLPRTPIALDFLAEHQELLTKINGMLDQLISETGPRYLELAKDDIVRPIWAAVQSAPADLRQVQMPEIEYKSTVFVSQRVVGSGVVEANGMRFAGNKPTAEDIKFNEQNRGYLLALEITNFNNFQFGWSLSNLSNAAAIVLDARVRVNQFKTHVGSYFRELGIPVLEWSALIGERMETVKERLEQGNKFLVYADEFKERGFVALV